MSAHGNVEAARTGWAVLSEGEDRDEPHHDRRRADRSRRRPGRALLAAGPAHATASPSDPWEGLGLGIGNGTGSGMFLDYGTIGILQG